MPVSVPVSVPVDSGGGPIRTSKLWVAVVLEPSASVAPTVIVTRPSTSGCTATSAPVTLTVASAVSDDSTLYVNASPSGSRNACVTVTIWVLPPAAARCSSKSGSLPTATGPRFDGKSSALSIRTANLWVAVIWEPSASVAVTVTRAEVVTGSMAGGCTLTSAPVTLAITTAVFDDSTLYVNASPSGSRNACVTVTIWAISPAASRWFGSVPTASGPWFR